jgi:hypothetical protein
MRRFVFRPEEREPHRFEREARDMCERLTEAGYEVPLHDLILAWDAYSESVCATWISAHGLDGEDILDRVRSYLEEVDGPSGPDIF